MSDRDGLLVQKCVVGYCVGWKPRDGRTPAVRLPLPPDRSARTPKPQIAEDVALLRSADWGRRDGVKAVCLRVTKTVRSSRSTLLPFDCVGSSDLPDGVYSGHDLSRADMGVIYSVGPTPVAAVKAFCRARGLGEIEGEITPLTGDAIEAGDNGYTWGCRFKVDGGTSMKAAGIHVPGGVVCTWWK